MTKESKDLGTRGETAAAAYLERIGMTVVERNWRCTAGEIDIVAIDERSIVFVEVKTRRSLAAGTPEEAVSPTKQRRLGRLARNYVSQTGDQQQNVRFDVITIIVLAEDRALLRHHRAAFVVEA